MLQPRPATVIYYKGIGTSTDPVSRALVSSTLPIPHIDGTVASDSSSLARALQQTQEALRAALLLAQSNPYGGSVGIYDVPILTSQLNVIFVLNHGLGRPARYEVRNARGAVWSGYAPNPQPSTIDTNNQLAIIPANAGTFDFVFI